MRYTQIYLDWYDAICSSLEKFKLSPENHGKCDPFTFINFCAHAPVGHFQTLEPLYQNWIFSWSTFLVQSQSQDTKQAGFLHQSISVMQKVTLYNDCLVICNLNTYEFTNLFEDFYLKTNASAMISTLSNFHSWFKASFWIISASVSMTETWIDGKEKLVFQWDSSKVFRSLNK